MRTALVLLLLLALAAIPGSIIPQSGVDSLKTSRWQDAHPQLTPVYERLGLFDGLRLAVVLGDLPAADALAGRLHRAAHASSTGAACAPRRRAAPRNLTRLPDHASYTTDAGARRGAGTGGRRCCAGGATASSTHDDGSVSAEKGYLREAGNLLFHLSVLVVLVGFALGGLFGYKGGVILVVGNGFSNNLTQYDDFVPGSLFKASDMEPFTLRRELLRRGLADVGARARAWRGRSSSELTYRTSPDAPEKTYDLKVNHPLTIGDTEVFLIGHGYAPVITVRDGNGDVVYSGPTIFLPTDQTLPRRSAWSRRPTPSPRRSGSRASSTRPSAFSKQTGEHYSAFGNTLDPRSRCSSTPGTSAWTTARRSRSTRSTRRGPRC